MSDDGNDSKWQDKVRSSTKKGDNSSDWRDKVKTPSEVKEKNIGGKSSLPQKGGKEVDWKKLTEEQLKEKEYDKELHGKNLDEAFAKKEKQTVKYYENRITKTNAPESPKAEKKLIEKIDDLIDKAGQGLKKAAPYLDDVAKLGSKALGVVGVFYPESTATDEEMRLHELKAQENQQRHKEIFQKSPEPSKLKPHEKSSLTEEKENIMLAMKDSEIDKSPFFTEPSIIENEPKISIEEKEGVLLAMRDINEVRPLFLEKIEPEIIKEINMPEPSFDGDSSDGGDGGGD